MQEDANPRPEDGAPETGNEAEASAETAALEEAAAGEQGAAEVQRLNEEVASLRDQLLRALAEVENVRARARRERDDAVRYAPGALAKDLIGVADNLRRALENLPPEGERDEKLANFAVGVEMTERALLEAFAKHGIVRIDPVGERLDPHRHEAMVEVPDPGRPAGTVSQVFEPGYVLHDRLLRPARVAVSKG